MASPTVPSRPDRAPDRELAQALALGSPAGSSRLGPGPGAARTPLAKAQDSPSASEQRRKSIDQVLSLDSKQKDALFSPKSFNRQQRALSKSQSLGLAQTVGNYVLGATIGKGRYSTVKLATHALTNEFVAIKIVGKARLTKEDRRVLERECQIMRLLSHNRIVTLYEVIDTKDHFYLVMEYVDGRPLSDKLPEIFKLKKKRRLPLVHSIFTQLVDALSYCHAARVVHRDVKPDNILVLSDGSIKLADWGFSTLASDLLNTHCGTPYYASPELFSPSPYRGPPSDIWASGVLLYYLYFGKLPFKQDPLREYIKAGNYEMPRDAPPQLRALVEGMLCTDPQKRMTARDVLHHPWVTDGAPAPVGDCREVPRAASVDQLAAPNRHDDIVAVMEALGFTPDEIQHSLATNMYDQVAATYYLLRDSPKLDAYRRLLLGQPSDTPATPAPAEGTPRRSRASSTARMFNLLLSRRRFSTSTSASLPGSPATKRQDAP